MYFTSWMDEMGRPAWIALTIVAFIVFWPIGLGILFFLIGSGRMACWRYERESQRFERWQDKMARHAGRWGRGHHHGGSGNRAFDEYRADTLRRLEEEERQFREFLDRLRFAKDKAEFDEFLAQRRAPTIDPQPQA